ncbi:MAG: Na/Pi cotransporter family protein [Planctomycetota bacterium]
MWTFLTIGGGIALILFAVRFLRKGLDRLMGPRIAHWMQRLARNRVRGFFTGIGLAVIAPSSTSMSALVVSAVKARQLDAKQTLPILLGANIGLTAMVLLIAFRLESAAPILILVGVLMFQFMKDNRARGIGQACLGIGFVFMGIHTIQAASSAWTSTAHTTSDLALIIEIAERHPALLLILATTLATAMQSSTATIALVIALSANGTITLPMGLVVVAGANLGTAITTLAFGWRDLESRRLAIANLALKLVVVVALMNTLDLAAATLAQLPLGVEAQIALSHTALNLIVAIVGLPLVWPVMALTRLLIRPTRATTPEFGPRHLHEAFYNSPVLALGLSQKEVLHAGEIVRGMLRDLWTALQNNDTELAKKVRSADNRVDTLEGEIRRFLTESIQEDCDPDQREEKMNQLRYVNELETIGDIIDQNLVGLVLKKIRLGVNFSSRTWAELNEFYVKVSENLLIADRVFASESEELAQSLLNHKAHLRELELRLRDERLTDETRVLSPTSSIHLDLLTHLKRINTHVTRIGYATLSHTNPLQKIG